MSLADAWDAEMAGATRSFLRSALVHCETLDDWFNVLVMVLHDGASHGPTVIAEVEWLRDQKPGTVTLDAIHARMAMPR